MATKMILKWNALLIISCKMLLASASCLSNNILTDEPTHSALKESDGTTHPSYINYPQSELFIILHCQLC